VRYLTDALCHEGEQLDVEPVFSAPWWKYAAAALGCVTVAAMAAGLTLGLTSIDEFGLHVLCNRLADDMEPLADEEARKEAQDRLTKDQACARRILPVISGNFFYGRKRSGGCIPSTLNPSNAHYVLVTLLICNAVANEALPLFLDRLCPAWLAMVLSVSVVLVFGEIVPSAVFTGKNQLALAAALSPVVMCVKCLLLPLAWPLSLLLDKVIGHEADEHRREDLKAVVRTMKREALELEEMNMIHGVLELHSKATGSIAKSIQQAKMLAHDEVIDEECIKTILDWGHSRLLVYRRDVENPARCDDVMGIILVKKLLFIKWDDCSTPGSLLHALKEPVVLETKENLLTAFQRFRDGGCHIAIVGDKPDMIRKALREKRRIPLEARPTMFCSLEDVLEEMLKEEIYDEVDIDHGRGPPSRPGLSSFGPASGLMSISSAGLRSSTEGGSLFQRFAARHVGSQKVAVREEGHMDSDSTSSASSDEGEQPC